MNTSPFQRLRRIRQLAMAHDVYPGALHTRFDHSLGTMHVAGRICARLKEFGAIDDDTTRVVRLAALLHDIGHGPFSHVFESVLERHSVHGDEQPVDKIHEKITCDIIRSDGELSQVLSSADRETIAGIIEGSNKRSLARDIVSSSLDADKMDYLLRDSHFAGVKYGQFDLDKIIETCRVYRSADESYLCFDEQGVYALEQLVLGKYHMGQQVYYHRIRAITDAMLVRGLSLAVLANVQPIAATLAYKEGAEFLKGYLSLCDDSVLESLSQTGDKHVAEIFSRLLKRNLWKQICTIRIDEVENGIQRDHLSRFDFNSDSARALEASIAETVGCEPEFVVVTRQSIKNPTFRMPSYRLGDEEIIVLDHKGIPHPIADYPDLTFALNKANISRETIQVFAPKDSWSDPADPKSDERDEVSSHVSQVVLAHAA